MMEVIQLPSSSSCSSRPCGGLTANDGSHSHTSPLINAPTVEDGVVSHSPLDLQIEEEEKERERDQLSILTFLIDTFRKSLIGCSTTNSSSSSMEIGWPSNVRHIAHVTFDRFHGFLGLPVEFEPEFPRRPPSASLELNDRYNSRLSATYSSNFLTNGATSKFQLQVMINPIDVIVAITNVVILDTRRQHLRANVFGVSIESMQLSFDARGNSVPTILLLMQRHLYTQGGLQAEGIFRINAENGQEEFVREQLNRGVVPDGTDVHCLAGLIKAWFRELPTGVLDPLSPEQVMQSQSEDECAQLVRLLPPTEAALLDWAINLMADIAQIENLNKMNARNIAMVFAPNMTQMADPLTALMYAVQVMNFLKTLIVKTLREREESIVKSNPVPNLNSFDDDGHHSNSEMLHNNDSENGNDYSGDDEGPVFVTAEPSQQSPSHLTGDGCETESKSLPTSTENFVSSGYRSPVYSCPCNLVSHICSLAIGFQDCGLTTGPTKGDQAKIFRSKSLQLSTYDTDKYSRKVIEFPVVAATEKNRGTTIIGRINSRTELAEAWR